MHAPAPVIPVSDVKFSGAKAGLEVQPSVVKETSHPTLRVRSDANRPGRALPPSDAPTVATTPVIDGPVALTDGTRPTSLHPSELIATHSAARSIRLRSR